MTSLESNRLVGRRILVTGAGGFIGSHLVERLVEIGCEVRALVRYTSRGHAGYLQDSHSLSHVDIVLGDLRDADAVRSAINGVDVVFHLGALVGIPYSYVHPQETVDTNVSGTLNVLLAARDQGPARVVHTSTSEVYGTAREVPISELHFLHGQSPYAASKIAADQLAESFRLSYGLPVTTVRPFNTYGPRQSTRAVIPTIITQAMKGTTVELGNLRPTRDFTYVSDTVNGFLSAATTDEAIGKTINLGTSQEVSIGELVDLVGEVLGKKLESRVNATRQRPQGSEVERLLADSTLAREILGWQPTIELREGLERTCRWVADRLDLYDSSVYGV
jgi:NAD dependent epimerase/dehydratase